MWDEVVQKIQKLKALDSNFYIHGAETHRYRFNPVVKESVLESTEKRLGCRLPEALRRFYLEVGNGGAGPDWGLWKLEALREHKPDRPWKGVAYYDEQSEDENLEGLLTLMTRHPTYHNGIVTNGKDLGKIIAYEISFIMSENADGIVFIYEEGKDLVDVYNQWVDGALGHFGKAGTGN